MTTPTPDASADRDIYTATEWRRDWERLNGKRLSAMRQLEAAQGCRDIDVMRECLTSALRSLGEF